MWIRGLAIFDIAGHGDVARVSRSAEAAYTMRLRQLRDFISRHRSCEEEETHNAYKKPGHVEHYGDPRHEPPPCPWPYRWCRTSVRRRRNTFLSRCGKELLSPAPLFKSYQLLDRASMSGEEADDEDLDDRTDPSEHEEHLKCAIQELHVRIYSPVLVRQQVGCSKLHDVSDNDAQKAFGDRPGVVEFQMTRLPGATEGEATDQSAQDEGAGCQVLAYDRGPQQDGRDEDDANGGDCTTSDSAPPPRHFCKPEESSHINEDDQ
mmetsp:Transcript_30070/g.65582  ORF Transcript_30070/g.65582 Transcript_30070/m.65582 type:complete len:263 (+) Transcript_30070:851-1639(+)